MHKFSTTCPCCSLAAHKIRDAQKKIISYIQAKGFSPHKYPYTKTRWRIKAKLAVRLFKKKVVIGLFSPKTHKIVSIESCQSHHILIQKTVHILDRQINKCHVPAYDELTGSGILRYIQILVDRRRKQIQLTLVINREKADEITHLVRALQRYSFITSLWINYNIGRNNVILSKSWEHISGEKYIWQEILGKSFAFHPGCFSQPNIEIYEKMLQFIRQNISNNSNVLDLFSGVGTIGLSCIDICASCTFIENTPFCHEAFAASVEKSFQKYKNILHFFSKKADEIDDLDLFDIIIVDPPRKGLGSELLEKLGSVLAKKLIYVSCNFTTFVQDTSYLENQGYQWVDCRHFPLFPNTEHFELIGILEKNITK